MRGDLVALLSDTDLTWTERRTRLQGWRGAEAEQADAAARAQRLAPALCASGALAGALTASPVLLAAFAATALVGTVAPNHPFESLYNRLAIRRGRQPLPPNRAAKRLACAMGVLFLGGAAVALAVGAAALGVVLALVFAVTAAFVAATAICIPSIIFTVLFGAERGTAENLVAALRPIPGRHGSAAQEQLAEVG